MNAALARLLIATLPPAVLHLQRQGTSKPPGVTATALGVAGYLRGESLDFARTVRADADARYRERYG